MKAYIFALRNQKELLRDPLSLLFGIGLPVVLLLIGATIQKNAPIPLFEMNSYLPGISLLSLSFISLFSGMLIARDRSTSFLTRLFASPLTAKDYIAGYMLPLLPLALIQSIACFAVASALGLRLQSGVLLALVTLIPAALLFIGIGLLLGCLFTDKQVGGIGSIIIQLVAFSSGIWFDLHLIGGVWERIAYALPFAHALEATRAAINGQYAVIAPHLWWTLIYALAICALAAQVFRRKMQR